MSLGIAPLMKAAGDPATPIQHLVVIFQENVSLDHYFGTYPYATNPKGRTGLLRAVRHSDSKWSVERRPSKRQPECGQPQSHDPGRKSQGRKERDPTVRLLPANLLGSVRSDPCGGCRVIGIPTIELLRVIFDDEPARLVVLLFPVNDHGFVGPEQACDVSL